MSHLKPHPFETTLGNREVHVLQLSKLYSNIRGVAMHGVDGGIGVAVGVTCQE